MKMKKKKDFLKYDNERGEESIVISFGSRKVSMISLARQFE